jgi:deoxyribose-phosphate aldolase
MNESLSVAALAKMIDHSLLHPTMTDADIRQGCELARQYNVATACVKPYSIPLAGEILAGSNVGVCAVIGFPHGNSTTPIKVREAEAAAQAGATEIDMVIQALNDVVAAHHALLKVIFENDYLAETAIVKLCEICSRVGVAFVKTSTGYGFVKQTNGMYAYKGATVEHLKLMRQHCAPNVQIKAAGGVRTLDEFLMVRALGVTRIGATATAAILEEAKRRDLDALCSSTPSPGASTPPPRASADY